jgi:hypothetical protein
LAILVEAAVKADSLSLSHPSLTHFLHSPPIISFSPYYDAKSTGNHSQRKNTREGQKFGPTEITKKRRRKRLFG